MASPIACSTSHTASPPDGSSPATNSDAAPWTLGDDDAGGAPASDGSSADGIADDGSSLADAGYGYADAACNPTLLDATLCDFLEALPCGLPPDAATENCYLTLAECAVLCGEPATSGHPCGIAECFAQDSGVIPDGAVTLECTLCGVGPGRRPEGLPPASPARCGSIAAALLADMARLEAASVPAFRRLARELGARGAPRRLVRLAERSARDEVRHARVMARLARRRGALEVPASVQLEPAVARPLEALAIENAVEGCVRESFAALLATRQGERAQDGDVRSEMRAIARDETRHAALAWAIDAWIAPRLPPPARARVRAAMHAAVRELRSQLGALPHEVTGPLGLPHAGEARALLDAFAAALVPERDLAAPRRVADWAQPSHASPRRPDC